MRIHTDATWGDLRRAAELSRTWARYGTDITEHGSRSRARAFEVALRGDSRRRPNSGTRGAGDEHAATWDQWGVFLAAVFEADPGAKCWAYDGAEAFHAQTADRFRHGWPEDAHGDHRFKYAGTPGEQRCRKCSAIQRWGVPASVSA